MSSRRSRSAVPKWSRGRASFWVLSPLPLIENEATSRLARTAGLLDIANGMVVRADHRDVAFPNLDLTAHFFTSPRIDWTGLDTTASFGRDGRRPTSSVLHDTAAPVGAMAQTHPSRLPADPVVAVCTAPSTGPTATTLLSTGAD